MSYRIEVGTQARSVLETLSPHLVLRLGHALAAVAEELTFGEEDVPPFLELDGCMLQLIVDHQEQLLKLVAVEPPVLLAAVPA
jgi:hypothetical protein